MDSLRFRRANRNAILSITLKNLLHCQCKTNDPFRIGIIPEKSIPNHNFYEFHCNHKTSLDAAFFNIINERIDAIVVWIAHPIS